MTNGPEKTIKRSRKGCHNCKRLKIKCDEKKPQCSYCIKTKAECDYSIKLTWGGRPYKNAKRRNSIPPGTSNNGSKPKKTKTQPLQFVMAQSKSMSYISDDSFSMTPSASTHSSNVDSGTPSSRATPLSGVQTPVNASTPQTEVFGQGSGFHGIDNIAYTNGINSNSIQGESMIPPSITGQGMAPTSISGESIHIPVKIDKHDMSQEAGSSVRQPSDGFTSIIQNLPDLSDGIESLSNALEKVAEGGHQFGLQNLEIFNRFLSSNLEDRKSPGPGTIPQTSPFQTSPKPTHDIHEVTEDDFLVDYSNDLVKVEAYMPRRKSNFSPDFLGAYSPLRKTPSHIEDLDDEERPLDVENSPSSYIDYFSQPIPPSLTPLPELLNQVPYYRQLMHFWVNVAAVNLVPAPSHIYKENPFQVLLPQMAMEYPALLTTMLASAAHAMSSITGKPPPTEIIDQLVARSCTMLLKMLQDKDEATSDGTLATVLLLSCYELISDNSYEKHRAHYLGARQIVIARSLQITEKEDESGLSTSPLTAIDGTTPATGKYSPESDSSKGSTAPTGIESDVNFFLMRWFVYIDVLGALAASKSASSYLNKPEEDHILTRSVDILNSQQTTESDTIDPKRDIDYVLGFDVKFLPHFTNIVLLIRKTDEYLAKTHEFLGNDLVNAPVIPIDIVTSALEVKEQLDNAFSEGEERRQAIIDKMYGTTTRIGASPTELNKKSKKFNNLIKQDNILRCTNKLFFDMGLLNLYRRVLRLPRDSSVIQNIANEMGQILENHITSLSSAEICSIFCSFCAGCDTLDEHYRQLFKDRFSKLAASGNAHAAKSLRIMQRCWDTGEDWMEAASFLDIELTLL